MLKPSSLTLAHGKILFHEICPGVKQLGPLYKGTVLLPLRTNIHSLKFRDLQVTHS